MQPTQTQSRPAQGQKDSNPGLCRCPKKVMGDDGVHCVNVLEGGRICGRVIEEKHRGWLKEIRDKRKAEEEARKAKGGQG